MPDTQTVKLYSFVQIVLVQCFTRKKGKEDTLFPSFKTWSGKRDSNSRPQPWQGCALPLSYSRLKWRHYIQISAKVNKMN